MTPEQFSDESPGKLVRTTLHKRRTTPGGLVEIDDVPSWAFVPNPLPPKLEWSELKATLFEKFETASASLGRVNGVITLTTNAKVLLRSLWMREAKLSSEIEGIHTTAIDIVLAGSQVQRVESSRAIEVWNAVKALDLGLASDLPWSARLVRDMHRELLTGVRGEEKRPGEFRQTAVYIGADNEPGQARFVPPPSDGAKSVVSCFAELEQFVHNVPPTVPALAALAMSHYQFESIHPFRDGNGRIGRALIVLQMCQQRLLEQPVVFLSGYFEKHKKEYTDRLLAVSTRGDWAGWIEFFLDAVIEQSGKTVVLAERIVRLRESQIDIVSKNKASIRLIQLIDHLLEWPVVTAKSVTRVLGIADPTARKDIGSLVEMKILRLVTDASYGQVWYAPDILAIIEGSDDEIEA